jgi:hypothetical protein
MSPNASQAHVTLGCLEWSFALSHGLTCRRDLPDARAAHITSVLSAMVPPSSLRFLLSSLITATLLFFGATARAQQAPQYNDDIQLIPTPSAPAPAPAPEAESDIRGMHCVPELKEVETRRAIPIACTVDYPVNGVELRYRMEGAKKWEKVELKQTDNGYTTTLPCTATGTPGTVQFYVFGKNENNKVIARVGRHESPLSFRLVAHSNSPPPALPGQQAPERCYQPNACPPEKLGTDACPGTQKPKPKPVVVPKKTWGASCTGAGQCQSGLECIKGSCDTPVKCEDTKDCSDGAECVSGTCHLPTAEEMKGRLGPAKHHWFGIHFGTDFYLMSSASGVCGNTTADSKDFSCFDGGNQYTGTPNVNYSNQIKGGLYFATVRLMLSYDYAMGRLLFGGRLGWAFRGAPKDFSPIHVELRAHYSLVSKPSDQRFRPYLGLAFGHAPVDAYGQVVVADCYTHDQNCINTTQLSALTPDVAIERRLNAYHHGAPFFFGPSAHLMYALSNDSALVFNFTVMLPDVNFEPTIGYELGL